MRAGNRSASTSIGVLGVEQVKRAVHLREQVALDQILNDQFGTLEVADPDLGSHEEAMRRRMEQERGSPFQKGTVAELESLDRVFVGVVQRFRRQPLRIGFVTCVPWKWAHLISQETRKRCGALPNSRIAALVSRPLFNRFRCFRLPTVRTGVFRSRFRSGPCRSSCPPGTGSLANQPREGVLCRAAHDGGTRTR